MYGVTEDVLRLLLSSVELIAEGLILHHERVVVKLEQEQIQVSGDGTIVGDLELNHEFRLHNLLNLQHRALLAVLENEGRHDVVAVLTRVPGDYAGLEEQAPTSEPAHILAAWNHRNVIQWHQVVENVEQVRKMLALEPVPLPRLPA
jgi:hypothetical protein